MRHLVNFIMLASLLLTLSTIGGHISAQERDLRKSNMTPKEEVINKFRRKLRDMGFDSFKAPINVTKDCSASQTCPDGSKLSCSIKGPNTSCGSTGSGVFCIKSNEEGETSGNGGNCS